MKEPTLVILAAGVGSRFGGLKQISPVDDFGHAIIDFSLYDAYRAGFRRVVFIIKHAIEEDFKEFIGRRMEKHFEVEYVFQEQDKLPEGSSVPEGRAKPWGTGHAVACCSDVIDGPFAVINSDDFYGPSAYKVLYDFLAGESGENEHAMVAYELRKTVTETGYVSRGVCTVTDGYLTDIVERTHIEKRGDDAVFIEDGVSAPLLGDVPVSMNFWGFKGGMMKEFTGRFPGWLDENLEKNPLKCEYFLPYVADCVIKEGLGTVRVLPCHETWHGVTYKEDLQSVKDAIQKMRDEGIYPEALLE